MSGNVEPIVCQIWYPFLQHFEANFVSLNRQDLSASAPVSSIVVAFSEGLNKCHVSIVFSVQWELACFWWQQGLPQTPCILRCNFLDYGVDGLAHFPDVMTLSPFFNYHVIFSVDLIGLISLLDKNSFRLSLLLSAERIVSLSESPELSDGLYALRGVSAAKWCVGVE